MKGYIGLFVLGLALSSYAYADHSPPDFEPIKYELRAASVDLQCVVLEQPAIPAISHPTVAVQGKVKMVSPFIQQYRTAFRARGGALAQRKTLNARSTEPTTSDEDHSYNTFVTPVGWRTI